MRDFSILSVVVIVSVVLGAGFYLFGGPAFRGQHVSPGDTSPVRFTSLQTGNNAPSFSERVNYRITSVTELGQLWQMVYGNNGPAIPPIDFSTTEVIAVFDGNHSQSGFAIAIARIEDSGGKRVVTVQRTMPPSTCTGTVGSSAPFEIVSMRKSDLPLDHVDQQITGKACSN
jgi:hypothetical protein